jgi:hypothetical protein
MNLERESGPNSKMKNHHDDVPTYSKSSPKIATKDMHIELLNERDQQIKALK